MGKSLGLEHVESWTGRLKDVPLTSSESGGSKFHSGDILFGKLRPYLAKVWVADRAGHYIGDFICITPKSSVDPKYLGYVLRTPEVIEWASSEAYGSKMPRAEWSALRECRTPMCSVGEQRAIADFLDHETAEIDAMVSDLEVSVDLLRERRTEVVNQYMYHAVDDRLAIKYLGCLQAGLTLGATYQEPIAEYPYLRVANVQVGRVDLRDVATVAVPERTAKTSRLKAGDVLMTEGGDRDKLGRGALWSGEVDPMLHQNHVFAFRCDRALSPKYLVYALEASEARMYFDLTARQSTNLASTNSTIVKNFKIPRRDILEQEMIVGQIEFEVAEIAQASDDIDRAITLAKERRAALISAAVTGQIDVTAKRKPVAEQLEDDIAQGVHTSS